MLLDLDWQECEITEGEGKKKKVLFSCQVQSLDYEVYQEMVMLIDSLSPPKKSKKETDPDKIDEEAREAGIKQISNPKMLELAKKILPTHVRNIEGIQVKKEGKITNAEPSDLFVKGQGATICGQILMQLFAMSIPSKEDKKK